MLTWRSAAISGIALAVLHTASPLTMWVMAAAAAGMLVAGRGLAPGERRLLSATIAMALAARLAYIAALLIFGIPHLNDLSVGALAGDDAYYLGRAIRARDVMLGFGGSKYDYFVVTDEYGRTSYLDLLTAMQVLFGPTPYGMRAVNALLFLAGATVLFRIARRAFGRVAAFSALIVLLFLPSLFVASVSLLKESSYFLATSVLLYCVVRALRWPRPIDLVATGLVAAVCLWLLDDLRRGAIILAVAGIAMGLVIRVAFETRWRAAAAALAGGAIIAAILGQPALHTRAIDGITAAAKTHAGHVFTVGHAYKLLDEGFYMNASAPASWPIELTDAQALRFVIRAAATFVATPLPWEMRSLSELAFLPEHVFWLLMILAMPAGLREGWRRNKLVTALLIGFALPTAAALAVTNGNVGTLLRLRGLVTPYLIWLGILGMLSVAEAILAGRLAPRRRAVEQTV